MIKEEIKEAVIRGEAKNTVREQSQRAATEAMRMQKEQRRSEWSDLVTAARAYLEGGALVAFVEEMTSRGAIDAVMLPGDPVLDALYEGELDLDLLLEAVNSIDGAHARKLGEAIEISWDKEEVIEESLTLTDLK